MNEWKDDGEQKLVKSHHGAVCHGICNSEHDKKLSFANMEIKKNIQYLYNIDFDILPVEIYNQSLIRHQFHWSVPKMPTGYCDDDFFSYLSYT